MFKYFLIFIISYLNIIAQPSNIIKNNKDLFDTLDLITDNIIKERLDLIQINTPIPLIYNEETKKALNHLVINRRHILEKAFSYTNYFFPLFEKYLDMYELPLELKYLTIIESGLDPFAKSKSGAAGLWQILYPTSQLLGLKVNSVVDERYHPIKATDAACRYLEYLFSTFNDWLLAIAAYNCGPTVLKNALVRCNCNTFWEVKSYLPLETQNYVPAFIATIYIFNYPDDYGFQYAEFPYLYQQVDTLNIKQPVNLEVVAKKLNISFELLKFFNPSFKLNYIPTTGNNDFIILPSFKISEFINFEKEIYEETNILNSSKKNNQTQIKYIVQKGDYLTKLALKFRCSPEDIKKWNNLTTNELKTGTPLLIWIDKENDYSIY